MIQIDDDPCRLVARIPDLDLPIRRIFRLDWLLDAVRSRELTLVAPHFWDDPREDLATLCVLDGARLQPRRAQQSLEVYLAPAWAQCWSLNLRSDTLLRAYSSVKLDPQSGRNVLRETEGVTATTTVRRLLSATEAWNAAGTDTHFIIGRVEYLQDQDIAQRIVNACNGKDGPGFFRTVQGRANSLLWKRNYFDHEQEVRLLTIARNWGREERAPMHRRFLFDPNQVFTSISFDPRLRTFEAREREVEIRSCGYTGSVTPDLSYQKIAFQLVMTRDWSAP